MIYENDNIISSLKIIENFFPRDLENSGKIHVGRKFLGFL